MTDIVKCIQCGADIVIDKPTERQLHASVAKTKFCKACATKRKCAQVKKYRGEQKEVRQQKKRAYVPDTLPTFEEVDRGYRKFWAKRGIDIDKVTEWGSL